MHFTSAILSALFLASSTVAIPSAQMACVVAPRVIGCGTRLAPRCCTVEEWNELHPDQQLPVPSSSAAATSTSSDAAASTVTFVPRAGNMMCTGNTIGCGTRMAPRCCTPEEWNSLHPDHTVAISTTLATPTGPIGAVATSDAPLEQWPSIINDVDPTPTGPVVPDFTGDAPLESWPSIINDVDPTPTPSP